MTTIKTAVQAVYNQKGMTGVWELVDNLPQRLVESGFCSRCKEVVPIETGAGRLCLICDEPAEPAADEVNIELLAVSTVPHYTLEIHHAAYGKRKMEISVIDSGSTVLLRDVEYSSKLSDAITKAFRNTALGFSPIRMVQAIDYRDQIAGDEFTSVEIHPVRAKIDSEGNTNYEQCQPGQKEDHFSVYLRRRSGEQFCIADFHTRAAATTFETLIIHLCKSFDKHFNHYQ